MVRIMTVRQTAKACGLPEYMLRTWIKRGECPGFQHGNRFMVNVDQLERKLNGEALGSASE